MSAPPVRRVAAAVVLRGDRVLVQTRPGPGRYQGFWEFPGGGIEDGESAEQAVVRECLEELDLQVTVHEQLHAVSWSYPAVRVDVRFFRCSASPDDEPRPVEGQELAWAGAAELDTLRFLPANAEVLALLVTRLAAADDRG